MGRKAGILGNPLGPLPQGSLCSAGKEPAFQESASGWGQGGMLGEPSKLRAGSPLQGPPWRLGAGACMGSKGGRLGTGPKGPSAELWRPFTFQALPAGPRGPFGPLPSQAPPPTPILLQPEHSRAASAPSAPSQGPQPLCPSWAPVTGDKCSGSGMIYCCSFLLLPVTCPPAPGSF